MCGRHRRLHLELFPSYAPELNPDDGVWKLAKEELANGRPIQSKNSLSLFSAHSNGSPAHNRSFEAASTIQISPF
jgi:transposase